MNYSTAVMLFNPNIRAIKVSYEKDTDKIIHPRYIFKTLDTAIKPGAYVVVPTGTRHHMTVVRVEEVDIEIDFEDELEIKWIIDKVNDAPHRTILAEEQKWISQMKAAEKRNKREEIASKMREYYKDEGIEKMPIAIMNSDALVIEHQKTD